MSAAVEELGAILSALERHRTHHKLGSYAPYAFQKAFHFAKGRGSDKLAQQRALMCANQIGKTTCAAYETAMHLTGFYPDWWEGWRFDHPVNWLVGSNTNEQTRDVCQAELFGDPTDDRALGTGAVPADLIGKTTRKPGVPNAYDSVTIAHEASGYSKVSFRAYEQGAKKHMGTRIHGGWMDEEPPFEIWSQYLRGTFATNGILLLTFTPEEGITEVVHSFMQDLKPGQALITAAWDDAPHMTPERREAFLAQIPKHERDMRTRGIPVMGSGLVFPVLDETIAIEPFELPAHWPRIIGVDFGWDHPFAAVWMAWDRESNTVYIYHTFREQNCRIPIAASAIKSTPDGAWAPIAWPHDGMHKDPQSGRPLRDLFAQQGLNMLLRPFANPPGPGQKEGQGGQGIEAGLLAMLTAMEEGRFRVFTHLRDWWDEKGTYHRKAGQVVKMRDDLMSASRYAFQSLRYSDTRRSDTARAAPTSTGMSNW